jgi:hypothetical protein
MTPLVCVGKGGMYIRCSYNSEKGLLMFTYGGYIPKKDRRRYYLAMIVCAVVTTGLVTGLSHFAPKFRGEDFERSIVESALSIPFFLFGGALTIFGSSVAVIAKDRAYVIAGIVAVILGGTLQFFCFYWGVPT